jgi:hypothetical protein
MGEALAFILQRFYYSLGSGCIINFYIMCVFFVLDETNHLPGWLSPIKNIEFLSGVPVLIFVFSALILGIFVDGFSDVCRDCFDKKKDKLLKRKAVKQPEQSEGKKAKKRGGFNPIDRILRFCFEKPTTPQACKNFWEQIKEEKSIKKDFLFMYDPDTGSLLDNKDDAVLAMEINARRILKKLDHKNFYLYKDLSFMAQTMCSSFFLISIFSLIAVIYAAVKWIINRGDSLIDLTLFYMVCFIVSVLFVFFTTEIACSFSRSYVCDIGNWYNALGLHKKKKEDQAW